jgi:AcrR family transcriptional regulator
MKKPPSAKNQKLFQEVAQPELKKGDLRKLQILQAAIESLGKNGWAKTNYETVGQICGLKRPHVAYHYPEWDTLIQAAIKFCYATGRSIVAEYLRDAKGPHEQLAAYIEGTFAWLGSNPAHGGATTVLWHLAYFDKRYRLLNNQIKYAGVERVYGFLSGGKPVDTKSDLWNTSLAIHGLLLGRCVEFLTNDGDLQWQGLSEQTFAQACALLPKGLKKK